MSDPLRRNRGRRGLDMLNKLQKESVVPIGITDMDVEEVREVDDKLVMLAKTTALSDHHQRLQPQPGG